MKKRQVAMATILSLAALAVTTVAAGQRLHYGQHSWTGISGFAGRELTHVLTPHAATNRAGDEILFGRALLGLTFIMDGHQRPATYSVTYRFIGKRGQTGLQRHELWHTEGASGPRAFSGTPARDGYISARIRGEDQYVTGINICTTRSGNTGDDTIQGMRLFLSTHEGGNNLERVGTAEVAQTEQCVRWHERQNCPRGSIATGVRIHHTGIAARGVALRCTALEGRQ